MARVRAMQDARRRSELGSRSSSSHDVRSRSQKQSTGKPNDMGSGRTTFDQLRRGTTLGESRSPSEGGAARRQAIENAKRRAQEAARRRMSSSSLSRTDLQVKTAPTPLRDGGSADRRRALSKGAPSARQPSTDRRAKDLSRGGNRSNNAGSKAPPASRRSEASALRDKRAPNPSSSNRGLQLKDRTSRVSTLSHNRGKQYPSTDRRRLERSRYFQHHNFGHRGFDNHGRRRHIFLRDRHHIGHGFFDHGHHGFFNDHRHSSHSFSFFFSFGHHFGFSYGHYYTPYYGLYSYPYYSSYYYGYAPYPYYYEPYYPRYFPATRVVYETNYYGSGYQGGGDYGYQSRTVDEDDAAYPDVDGGPPTLDDAWVLLADGYLNEARDAFFQVGELFPFEGEPQVGYAIAAGLLNDDDAAIFAMRKALRDDPEALYEVPENLALEGHLRVLLERYENGARGPDADRDALFMVAAIRFLLGEEAVGYFAINEAVEAGDDDESTFILRELLRDAMYGELFD